MTTKSKAATVAAKVDANIEYAKKAGEAALMSRSMRDVINDNVKLLRGAKVRIGKLNECLYAQAFIAERFKGKAASDNTKSVILSAFRKAVETGEDYNENASKTKAAAKKKAAKAVTKNDAPKAVDAAKPVEAKPVEAAKPVVVTKPAKDDDNTIVLSLPRKATAKQAAKQMRAFIEKMRQSESLAPLAAYIVDVLDEFDGTAEQF